MDENKKVAMADSLSGLAAARMLVRPDVVKSLAGNRIVQATRMDEPSLLAPVPNVAGIEQYLRIPSQPTRPAPPPVATSPTSNQ